MLFPYTYVPNQMEKMQKFVNFIFYQVWCCAPKSCSYNLNLFDANPPLKEVLTDLYYSDKKTGNKFLEQIQAVYQSFSQLNRKEIIQLKRWYQGNNNLQEVCSNNPEVFLARYTDIEAIDKNLAKQLGLFFKNLYSHSLLKLSALRAKIGNMKNHYSTFIATNKKGKCPFCGISDLYNTYHNKREAYDHYLPKSVYPFNSINFKNLVPTCHNCNSSYKTTRDPAHTRASQRRAIFYPYTEKEYTIELKIKLHNTDIDNLAPIDIDINFGPDELFEQLETWKDVYGIEERYKAKILGGEGKYWFEQVMGECRILDNKLSVDLLSTISRDTEKSPYAECNFLKKPFLDACKELGLFDDINV